MSNLLLSLPLLNCPFDKMCHTSAKHTLCRVFSGLVRTCQPPKGEKCEILNLEPGKIVQRNGYKAAGHKLRGKTRIVVNFKPHFRTLWVKKDDEGKDRSFCFFFGPYIKLRSDNLPI